MFIHLFIVCVCVHMRVHARVEVRGHLTGTGSLAAPWSPQRQEISSMLLSFMSVESHRWLITHSGMQRTSMASAKLNMKDKVSRLPSLS